MSLAVAETIAMQLPELHWDRLEQVFPHWASIREFLSAGRRMQRTNGAFGRTQRTKEVRLPAESFSRLLTDWVLSHSSWSSVHVAGGEEELEWPPKSSRVARWRIEVIARPALVRTPCRKKAVRESTSSTPRSFESKPTVLGTIIATLILPLLPPFTCLP